MEKIMTLDEITQLDNFSKELLGLSQKLSRETESAKRLLCFLGSQPPIVSGIAASLSLFKEVLVKHHSSEKDIRKSIEDVNQVVKSINNIMEPNSYISIDE